MSVPVLVVTGFLGAGKTSLINALLQSDHGLHIAAIVNDFGSINIDAALIGPSVDGIIGLKNGCICCSLQGDLLRTLRIVMRQSPPPELIIVEASGVADPSGIVQSLTDPVIWQSAQLQTVVCVVDATDAANRQDDPLWQAQLRGSDVLMLAKTDIAEARSLSALRLKLAATFKQPLLNMSDGLPVSALLDLPLSSHRTTAAHPISDDRFVHVEWDHDAPLALDAFQSVMGALAPTLLRAKGFVRFRGQTETMLFQLSGSRATLARADDAPITGCQLVLIGLRDTFDPAKAVAELNMLKV